MSLICGIKKGDIIDVKSKIVVIRGGESSRGKEDANIWSLGTRLSLDRKDKF
jgi:hypothetical protein